MTKRDDKDLTELVHDTPSKPMTALDKKLEGYLGDEETPSVPPPPWMDRRREAILEKVRPMTRSGSWDLESLLGDQQTFYERALERAIAEERLSFARDRMHKAELEAERRKRRWESIVDRVIVAVASAAGVGILGFVLRLIILAVREGR